MPSQRPGKNSRPAAGDAPRRRAGSKAAAPPLSIAPPPAGTPKRETRRSLETISQAHARLSVRLRAYEKLLHLFTNPRDIDRALETVLDIAYEAVDVEAGSLLLVDEAGGDLFFHAARGPVADRIKQFRVPLGQGFAGHAARHKRTLAVSDVARDPRFHREISEALGFPTRSILAAPIIFQGRALGVIELVNKRGSDLFLTHEIDLVERIARAAGNLIALSEALAPAGP
jgi:GAF domain-containing protein